MNGIRASVFFLLLLSLPLLSQEPGDHWSFRAVAAVEPPADGHPLDAFLAQQLESAELEANPRADARTQLRRVHLGLTGLPPSPELIDRFDGDDVTYRKQVDELLASERFGERWASFWLDLVRYADTHGFEVNTPRPNAWPYRDYVIRAFNEDKPYHDFAFEQLAGDSVGQGAATGFLVAGAVLLPGQIGKDEVSKRRARQDALDEIIVGTSDTFLGLSIGCARCHDHKTDPIGERDYYGMQAFFAGVDYGDRPIESADHAERRAEAEALMPRIASARKTLDGHTPPARSATFVFIDDEDAERTTHLVEKNGHGTHAKGTGRGHVDDPGSAERVANLGRPSYTWWDNKPGRDTFTYNPGEAGRFRVWLSWGVHGSGVHTHDARYVLDHDGDLQTRADQQEIATVHQGHFAGSTDAVKKQPMWSGLHDAGVHTFSKDTKIVLRGGDSRTGITADLLLLEAVSKAPEDVPENVSASKHPELRAPVNARRNVEVFEPVEARFIRFRTLATVDNNKHEPCIDELEVYAAAGTNLARRAQATASGIYAQGRSAIHRLEHVNDGKVGNAHSFITDQRGGGWVQLELAQTTRVERVVWGRDRTGAYPDRLAVDYRIETSLDERTWTLAASSQDRVPHGTPWNADAALQRSGDVPADLSDTLKTLRELEAKRASLLKMPVAFAGKFRSPEPTYLLRRGDSEQQVEPLDPSVPAWLGGDLSLPEEASEQARRVALARWVTRADNPLFARVIVNRLWQWHFGQGLVATASDFGTDGAVPSHPELLDWLATELVQNGWSLKHMHRLIVTSDAYRRSSAMRPEATLVDADNRLLWRFASRRLEAESIRDSMLAVNGRLNLKTEGPGFDFFTSRGGLSGFPVIETFKEAGLRRMVYAHKVRMERVPVFGAFDCPDAGQATPARARSTTALQALNLFNSRFTMDQAAALAERAAADRPKDPLGRAFGLVLGREPSAREREASEALVREHGLAAVCRVLYNTNEFLLLP